MEKKIKHNVTIRLTDDDLDALRLEASKELRPLANHITKILRDYLELKTHRQEG